MRAVTTFFGCFTHGLVVIKCDSIEKKEKGLTLMKKTWEKYNKIFSQGNWNKGVVELRRTINTLWIKSSKVSEGCEME